MHAHTYTPHTSTRLHLHMFFVCVNLCFLAMEIYQLPTGLLLPLALLDICMHMHTHPHASTFMYTHRSHASNMCIYTHKHGFGSHPSPTHMHTHTNIYRTGLCFVLNYYVISPLSLVAMSTLRCEPALQECTLMHTGMYTHTDKHSHKQTHAHTQVQTCTHSC